MLRKLFAVGVVALVSTAAGQAHAQYNDGPFYSVMRDFRRNNAWPCPFSPPDRCAAKAPFSVMIENGWRTQNTLSEYHFDAETGKINEAGVQKVRSILLDAPIQYRTIFVVRSDRNEVTETRVSSAQETAERYAFDGEAPRVMVNNIPPRGWSADYVNEISRKFQSSTPEPRLPKSEDPNAGAAAK